MVERVNKKFKSEDELEQAVVDDLKALYGNNIVCFKNSYKEIQRDRSRPDHFFCFFGRFVAVEFKNGSRPKRDYEYLQEYTRHQIHRAKGYAVELRSYNEAIKFFHDLWVELMKSS